MNSSDTRVATYLDDLARMLSDLDPGERDEVLAGIREHLDATLAEHSDDPDAVDAALLRLGPAEKVAAEARTGQPRAPSMPGHPLRTRIAALTSLTLVGVPALTALAARLAVVLSGGEDGAGWPESVALLPHPSEALVDLMAVFPFWLIAIVVTLLGPSLSMRTKWSLVALGPLTSLLIVVSTVWMDPMAVSTPLGLAALLAVVGWMVVTAKRVWRETST